MESGVNVNIYRTQEHFTPLKGVATNGHLEVVKYLIQNGADVNLKNDYKCTALSRASIEGHVEIGTDTSKMTIVE